MMTLTQYLLSKVAEEATELAKEALKGQQQGLFSNHRGRKNYEYIQDEYIDLIARSTLLNQCDDIIAEVGEGFNLLVDRYKLDRDINVRIQQSIDKMAYYAYMAFSNGYLRLSEREEALIVHYHNEHIRWMNSLKI